MILFFYDNNFMIENENNLKFHQQLKMKYQFRELYFD